MKFLFEYLISNWLVFYNGELWFFCFSAYNGAITILKKVDSNYDHKCKLYFLTNYCSFGWWFVSISDEVCIKMEDEELAGRTLFLLRLMPTSRMPIYSFLSLCLSSNVWCSSTHNILWTKLFKWSEALAYFFYDVLF